MKPAEFSEIMMQFVEEQKRWKALKVGDTIYDVQARGFEFDYHKMQIDTIDVEERLVTAHDINGNHSDILGGFLTEEEFNNME